MLSVLPHYHTSYVLRTDYTCRIPQKPIACYSPNCLGERSPTNPRLSIRCAAIGPQPSPPSADRTPMQAAPDDPNSVFLLRGFITSRPANLDNKETFSFVLRRIYVVKPSRKEATTSSHDPWGGKGGETTMARMQHMHTCTPNRSDSSSQLGRWEMHKIDQSTLPYPHQHHQPQRPL